jgi:2-polyprenyl-3-methyl-5-hydroxy-6-metoxy-1,4-benzoquinol methylase
VPKKTIFSFVVDAKHRFTYEGWHLARSLIEHCGGDPTAIHVQCTPEVSKAQRAPFHQLGCIVHEMPRFGDGKHCNKLNQLPRLHRFEFDRAVLLDADTLAVADIRGFLRDDVIMGKPVDAPRPPIEALDEVAKASGLTKPQETCAAERGGLTYVGNCNGGFYSVPKIHARKLSYQWRKWALWLLNNVELLKKYDMPQHVDQVSFWLAIQHGDLPFANAPANVNFFPYLTMEHTYIDTTRRIALVHYHSSLNLNGFLTMRPGRNRLERAAINKVNRQLASRFDNRIFWNLRYERFPNVGSGRWSRGRLFHKKRLMLRRQGIEAAASVLDIGCGDARVLINFAVQNYVGVDVSTAALDRARKLRPDLTFRPLAPDTVEAADFVLCLDVLIHQRTEADYFALIDLAARKTKKTLLISGFARNYKSVAKSSSLFFHEALETSLLRTRRFSRIERVAELAGVFTYRCDV